MTATQTKQSIRDAATRLVNSFSKISGEWLLAVINKVENEDFSAVPMWGWCFIVDDPCDKSNIRKLLQSAVPDNIEGLLSFIDDYQLDIDLDEFREDHHHLVQLGDAANEETDLPPEYDLVELGYAVDEAWSDSGDEDYWLHTTGWEKVGDTGIWARDVDGELILGLNSGGHDFYEAYWIPLYELLGYGWHKA